MFQIELRLHLKGIVVHLMTCHCKAVLTFDQSVLAFISKNIFESLFLVFFFLIYFILKLFSDGIKSYVVFSIKTSD